MSIGKYIIIGIPSNIIDDQKLYYKGILVLGCVIGEYDNYPDYLVARKELPSGEYYTIFTYGENRKFKVVPTVLVEEL